MPLVNGTRLGAYEVSGALGAGGMGEVYRARDTKLGRAVALKVLPDDVAADPGRTARFEREAKALAALNHPRIAALFGMEAAGGRHFLVMELVEGETLAERLQRGPMAIADALATLIQIAEALEAAHEKGIVHRDLKPANVKITPDGAVKVLDFGLAKAVEPERTMVDVTQSPTLSVMATQAGVILGTAAYMSPEQAKGFPADPRSDVFAFGVVAYELISGRRPFAGDTAADVLASVLAREPDLTALPPNLNLRLYDLVRRCLEKNPKRRWQAIGDVRAELETIAADPHGRTTFAAARPAPLWRRALPIAITAVVAAAATALGMWMWSRPAPPQVARFTIPLPEGQHFTNGGRPLVAISPDGTAIVYVASQQLHLRSIASADATPIAGTQNAQGVLGPTFSPDGQSIAFWSGGDLSLKRIPIGGGNPTTICPADRPYGIAWGQTGVLFGDPRKGILRVSPNGGQPEVAIAITAEEVAYGPAFLPGEEWVVFTLAPSAAVDRWSRAKLMAQSLRTGERKVLVDGGNEGRYAASGHLVFAAGGLLQARAFDLRRVETRGGSVAIVEGVRRSDGTQTGTAHYSVSANGTLVYVPGPAFSSALQPGQLALVDRQGAIERLNLPDAAYEAPRVSPDGRQLAVGIDDDRGANIWLYDLSGATSPRRLTVAGRNRQPVWTDDGQRIVFQSDRDGDPALFWQRSDGSDTAQRLTTPAKNDIHMPESASPAALSFTIGSSPSFTLWTMAWADRKATTFGGVTSVFPANSALSPDGRWLAYSTFSHSGAEGLWVEPYPATGVKHLISRTGLHPVWSRDGHALVHSTPGGTLSIVPVSTAPSFQAGVPVVVPVSRQLVGASAPRNFDAAPDGRILCVLPPQGGAQGEELRIVLNWFEELRQRVPVQ